MELINHPGYIDIKAISEKAGSGENHIDRFSQLLEEERQKVSFKDFLPYIKTEGLKEDEKNKFIDLLKSIYQMDNGVSWTPGNCSHADYLAEQVRSFTTEDSRLSGLEVNAKRFYRSHFWIEIKGISKKDLIIDPFGIPKEFPVIRLGQEKNVLPYFGPITAAPESVKLVYRKGKSLDDWGTRDLPPGFHP